MAGHAQRRSCPIVVLAVGSERHREKCLVDGGGRRRENRVTDERRGGPTRNPNPNNGQWALPFPSLPLPSFGTFPNDSEVPDYFVPVFSSSRDTRLVPSLPRGQPLSFVVPPLALPTRGSVNACSCRSLARTPAPAPHSSSLVFAPLAHNQHVSACASHRVLVKA